MTKHTKWLTNGMYFAALLY